MSGSFLRVDIRTVDEDGLPTSTVVATTDAIDYDEITHDGFYQFVFPSTVTLPDPAARYAIVLYEEGYPYDPIDQSPAGWLYSPLDDPYDGGDRSVNDGGWVAHPGSDHFFKVFYSAPTETTVEEHIVSFDQDNAKKMFVSTDNTMELDMRFMVSICLDGTGTMLWADPNYTGKSEVYLFIREILLRAPFSYIDVWAFDDTIYEGTTDGPTDSRPEYSSAIGSVFSTGTSSRMWVATEQAIGNLDPSSAVAAILRDDTVDEALELMRQMNRIDYDSLTEVDAGYDPSTGFDGIKKFGRIEDYLLQEYADTMGREGVVISDGLDVGNEVDPSEIAILANGVMGDGMTPVNFFAMGSSHWTDGMVEVSEATGGLTFEIGEETSRVRESFNVLLNDRTHTMFQGEYEDMVEFDQVEYIDSIEIGVLMPDTTHLTFEVCYTYDGITYSGWEEIPPNNRWTIKRFVMGFRYRIKAWMGNTWGGNYYDIYGYFPDMVDESGTVVRAGCRHMRYYGSSSATYDYESDVGYYYRDEHYPSPKVFSLRYWTVSPSIRYMFTTLREGGDISEYLLVPMESMPETSQVNWGIVRGDSIDFADAEAAVTGRMGVLPDRKSEVYFTPDVSRIGLKANKSDQQGMVYSVVEESGEVATWEDTDTVTVYSNGEPLDIRVTRYSLIGARGYIVFETPRSSSDVITVDIVTPGEAAYRDGEICTTNDYRNYHVKNGPWTWDAEITVRKNGTIVRDGYNASPDQGLISFHKELDPGVTVTVEVEHSGSYRVGMEILDYDDDDLLDEPDFAFMFQVRPATETLYIAGQTNPPEVVGDLVTLTPTSPGTTDRLVVSYRFHQEQGNAESGTSIRWYRKMLNEGNFYLYDDYDDRNVMRTSDVPSLNPSGPFHEHDQWFVVVTPRDVNNEGVPVQSNIVTIGGTAPPYITAATITAADGDPALTTDTDGNLKAVIQDLVADYTYVDPNLTGDQTASDLSVVEWYRKEDSTPRYTGKTVSSTLVKSGDVWFYVVTPYDGILHGDPITSEDVVVTAEKETTV